MAANLRLSKWEQEILREKAIKINKKLVNNNFEPMKDSEIIHLILAKTLPLLEANEGGVFIREYDSSDSAFWLGPDFDDKPYTAMPKEILPAVTAKN